MRMDDSESYGGWPNAGTWLIATMLDGWDFEDPSSVEDLQRVADGFLTVAAATGSSIYLDLLLAEAECDYEWILQEFATS